MGIGKTILLKSIASKLNQEFEFIHFTNFMNHIKKKLDKLDSQKNPLDKVIDELKDQKKLIFIDRNIQIHRYVERNKMHFSTYSSIS